MSKFLCILSKLISKRVYIFKNLKLGQRTLTGNKKIFLNSQKIKFKIKKKIIKITCERK